jgi:hypothetical protein
MMCPQDLLDGMDGVALLLDRDLNITAGGWKNWSLFWRANGGVMPAPSVLGGDITRAFAPGPVRAAFRAALLGVVAGERPPLRLEFRCDSPRVQRRMHLSVTPCGPGLLYHALLLSERPWPMRPLPLPPEPPVRCTLCGRVPAPEPDAGGATQAGALDWVAPAWPAPEAGAGAEHDLCPRCHLALAAA